MPLIRWSHNPAIELLGVGNRLRLAIPLECMRKEDELIVKRVEYKSEFRELQLDIDILRRPFLSPYIAPQRFEPNEFFEQNFKRLAEEDKHPPQLS